MDKFERSEYKYFVPFEMMDELRARFLTNMDSDPFCSTGADINQYTVRSIYFDTRHYLFYYEKVNGIKVRKKLRIRLYGLPCNQNIAFVEIKRKFGNKIYKERVKTLLEDTPLILNGGKPPILSQNPTFLDRSVMDKFIYLTKRLKLEPKVLVAYEREAFRGLDDTNFRVTFDKNVRSYPNPDLDMIFQEQDLRTLRDSHFILEIKFNGRMPVWVRNIINEFRLRVQSISKYCNCLDNWLIKEEQASE